MNNVNVNTMDGANAPRGNATLGLNRTSGKETDHPRTASVSWRSKTNGCAAHKKKFVAKAIEPATLRQYESQIAHYRDFGRKRGHFLIPSVVGYGGRETFLECGRNARTTHGRTQ